jgi:hypothetical protein
MKLSIRRSFFILMLLGLFVMTIRPIADPDFWWHLKTGQIIIQNHSIPNTDPFSYTKAGQPWITHEWLSELIIYELFAVGNYWALILVFSIFITISFLLAYFRSPKGSRPYIAGFALLLGAISSAPTWGVRPQIFSLLLVSLFVLLIDRFINSGKLGFIYPLPLLMLLWVNLHAGYFLGLVVIGIFIFGCLGEIVLPEFFRDNHPGIDISANRLLIVLLIVLGLSILAALANPNGIKIILYPFQTLTSPSMQKLIQEWMSPDFHQIIWQPFAWIILGLIGFGLLSKKRLRFTDILLITFFGYGALIAMRNEPFFAIVSIPILSNIVSDIVTVPVEKHSPQRLLNFTAPIIIIIAFAAIVFQFVRVVRSQRETEVKLFPQGAVTWLLSNKPQGNIFNKYSWGGFLIWKAYPEYRVFIDGRADVYGDAFIFNYINIYQAEPGWEQQLIDKNISVVLVDTNSPIANELKQSLTWKISYQDTLSTIFTR